MNERMKMQKQLASLQFTLWELHLYLDTHPGDSSAQLRLSNYKKSYAVMRSEYEEKYGALSPSGASGTAWTKDPWPWETKEESGK